MRVRTRKPSITELAARLTDAMPRLSGREPRLALALYRRLAQGVPVGLDALATDVGADETEVAKTLERWPGVFFADDGRVVSFWGLSIPETTHRFRIDGHELHTWCAWDALFIPELIGRTAEVESRPPSGDETVRLVIDPDGVREVLPRTAVVSMLSPPTDLDERVITSFCHFVHFFPSPSSGKEWVAANPETFLLSVSEAHELGRIVNTTRFGADIRRDLQPGGEST